MTTDTDTDQFRHLAPSLHDAAKRAAAMGLAISHYNSGGRHPDNGTRIFRSPGGAYVDHFRGDHLAHLRTGREVNAFLTGFEAGTATATRRQGLR